MGRLRDVENHAVVVQLGRAWHPVDGPRRVVVEHRRDEAACRFRELLPAQPRLGVRLELAERHRDGVPMGLADALVATDQGHQRNRFRRAEGGVEPSAMLHRRDLFALGIHVAVRREAAINC